MVASTNQEAVIKYRIIEYEGSTRRKIKTRDYDTREEAMFEHKRLKKYKLTGVDGRYTHYYSYPEMVKVGVKPKSKDHLWSDRAKKLREER